MKKIDLKLTFHEFSSLEELSENDRSLLLEAKKASDVAYAPYSQFYVGAALELENGKTVIGTNQENVAYPSGLCAERVGIFAASTQYPGVAVNTIAITAKSKVFDVNFPVSPCGACRQVLSEYERLQGKPIRVILSGEKGKILIIDKIEDLLPFSFIADKLKKD